MSFLILHPAPEDGKEDNIYKETIYKEGDSSRIKCCPSLSTPSSRQRTALLSLLWSNKLLFRPLPPSPLLSPAFHHLSCWHLILGVGSHWSPLGICLCRSSPDSPRAPLQRRLHSPATYPSSSNLQHLEQFQNVFTDNFLKGHSSNGDKPALISSAEQRETG